LSKGYGLIDRFSEDIDITAFREDLDQAASADELEGMSGKKRQAKLDAIRDACQAWVKGALRDGVSARIAEVVEEAGRVEIDNTDRDGQTLLMFYPSIVRGESEYIRPAVRIECGAKSALDPHGETTIRPYVAEELAELNISVTGVTTIDWVAAEGKCCPFFDFHIDLEREGNLLCLRLTGEEGIKPFIRSEFRVPTK
jgi:hypothetical protein